MTVPTFYSGSTVLVERDAWRAMAVLSVGFFIALLDQSMVAVALPEIQRDYGASINQAMWVSSAYLLAVVVPLIITGRLGDMYGQRTLYRVGIASMAVGAAFSALAPTIELLIAGRVIQGLGASIQMPQTMSVINRVFARERRGRALGVWGIIGSVASLIGPILGGFLTGTFGWHAVFWVPIPFAILAVIMAGIWVPKLPRTRRSIDYLSAFMSLTGLGAVVWAVQQAPEGGTAWMFFLAVGVVALAVFLRLQATAERRGTDALVPLTLFADRNYFAGVASIASMGFMAASLMLPVNLWMQDVQGLSAHQAGLVLAPMAVASMLTSPVAGILVDKLHPRSLSQGGFLVAIAALLLGAWMMSTGVSPWWFMVPAVILGVGQSFVWGTNSATAMRDVDGALMGVASGVYNTSRQVGSVVGVALVSAALQLGTQAAGLQPATAWAVVVIVVAMALGLGAVSFFRDTLHGQARPN